MNRVWTQEHDAVIAEKCEGFKRSRAYIPSRYDIDPAAQIRAAEAWRKRKPGRHYLMRSAVSDEFGERPETAALFRSSTQLAASTSGPAALAWALYEAVKDA